MIVLIFFARGITTRATSARANTTALRLNNNLDCACLSLASDNVTAEYCGAMKCVMHIATCVLVSCLSLLLAASIHADEGESRLNSYEHRVIEANSVQDLLVWEYAISCALDSKQSREITYKNQTYQFHGTLGYARNFFESPALVSQQQIVSACVLARTNLQGKPVSIALAPATKGSDQHALMQLSQSPAQYTKEGAFFGNLFVRPAQKFVCSANGNSAATINLLNQTSRLCTLKKSPRDQKSVCGFVHVGTCKASHYRQENIDYSQTALMALIPQQTDKTKPPNSFTERAKAPRFW